MKILIIKTSSLGDIIHAFPVVSYLRQKFPAAQIDWVVEKPYAELVLANSEVDHVITIDTRMWRASLLRLFWDDNMKQMLRSLRTHKYDVVFDLQGNIKSGVVTAITKATAKVGFARKNIHEWPNLLFTNQKFDVPFGLNVCDENLYLVKSFYQDHAAFDPKAMRLKIEECDQQKIDKISSHDSMKILVCSGSAWRNKQLTPAALRTLLEKISNLIDCTFLFAWGTVEEKNQAEVLAENFAGRAQVLEKLSLPVLQNLMAQVNLVIAMDSLPLHLAGTTETPTFAIFGASAASKYNPKGQNRFFIQGVCPYGKRFERRCPILRTCSTGACIRNFTGDELFEQFAIWWVNHRSKLKLQS